MTQPYYAAELRLLLSTRYAAPNAVRKWASHFARYYATEARSCLIDLQSAHAQGAPPEDVVAMWLPVIEALLHADGYRNVMKGREW